MGDSAIIFGSKKCTVRSTERNARARSMRTTGNSSKKLPEAIDGGKDRLIIVIRLTH